MTQENQGCSNPGDLSSLVFQFERGLRGKQRERLAKVVSAAAQKTIPGSTRISKEVEQVGIEVLETNHLRDAIVLFQRDQVLRSRSNVEERTNKVYQDRVKVCQNSLISIQNIVAQEQAVITKSWEQIHTCQKALDDLETSVFYPGVNNKHIPANLHKARADYRRNLVIAFSNLAQAYLRVDQHRESSKSGERFLVSQGLHTCSLCGFDVSLNGQDKPQEIDGGTIKDDDKDKSAICEVCGNSGKCHCLGGTAQTEGSSAGIPEA